MSLDIIDSQALLSARPADLSVHEARDFLRKLSLEVPAADKDPKPIVKMAGCIFLERTPVELRRKIYFYLVVSDKTSDLEPELTVDEYRIHGASLKYGLTPAILLTCKQIYAEASEMLYADNTFAIECTRYYRDKTTLGPCTLSRHHLPGNYEQPQLPIIQNLPAFDKVQHWKVTVRPASPSIVMTEPQDQVTTFCRATCRMATLKSLIISTQCGDCLDNADDRYLMRHVPEQEKYRAQRESNLMVTLKPFELFRGLATFDIKCPVCNKSMDGEDGNITNLQSLVKSEEPVHHVFKTYEVLLAYAQAFERIPRFRNDMASDRNHPPLSLSHRHRRELPRPTDLNPFVFPNVHPVEAALRLASATVDTNDYDEFKKHRINYHRIASMTDQIMKLVEKLEIKGCCLGPHLYPFGKCNFQLDDDFNAMCLIRLDDYAQTFIRDSPDEIRLSLRRYDWIIKRLYADLPRERHIRNVQSAYDLEDFIKFRESLCLAAKDMYDQWLEIRQARLKLIDFDWHSEQTGCEIDLEFWRDDEPFPISIN
ncbi:hypothetical protein BKA65DRAFT_578488 [Rhexocercosporidium sp. MPI-PUGE-AT-0058]|nr:hypothetical protein BKA65DRAFT_578488 [Rhexocercosporidium sp. MPI-PUGE-AT-0058]